MHSSTRTGARWASRPKGRGDGLGFEFGRCDFKLGEVSPGADGQPDPSGFHRDDERMLQMLCSHCSIFLKNLSGD